MPAPCPFFKRVRDMACEKTGAHARLADGRWAHGDMHSIGGLKVFRVCSLTEYGAQPEFPMTHYTIHAWEEWFDEFSSIADNRNSTMLCLPHQLINHGYDGILSSEAI